MISGPRVVPGVDSKGRTIADVLPTIFEIIGYEGETDFDSKPIETIFAA